MRFFLVIYLSLNALLSFGNSVSISGNALFFAREIITLYQLENGISMEKKELAQTVISEKGEYSFSISLEKPQHLIIKIEMREIVIHAHPNSDMVIDFLPIENVENQRVSLKYHITYNVIPENTAPETEYIRFTSNFAKLISTGNVSTNFNSLYSSFFNHTDSIYSNYTSSDPLFTSFYTYFKANAYLTTDTSKTLLRKMYLHPGSKVDYSEYQYQKFVQALLIPRIGHLFTTKKNEFEKAKKEYKIYDSLLDQLLTDSLFSTKELASLGLLYFIRSSASDRHLNFDEKSAILGQIANFCEFPQQQSAARFFQRDGKKLQKNSEAPTFSLQDSNGENVNLTDFRDQNVYLGFIHSQSRACLQDLQVIENLAKKYRKMQFVLVLTNRDSISNTNLLPTLGNIHYLYLSKNYSVLEKYEIWSVPVYFLLDKHGYFLQSPSRRPGDMYPIFEQLFDKKRNSKGYEIILD